MFQKCGTQWRVSPTGHYSGLDYSAVIALAGLMKCANQNTMEYIRLLEYGALCCYLGKTLEFALNG